MSDFDFVLIGNVVTTERVIENGYVAVAGGRIAAVGEGTAPAAAETQDVRGAWIFPGAIDGQVHTGSQANQEGFRPGSRAAAAGGVTTMVDMPYDEVALVADTKALDDKIEDVQTNSHVDVGLFGTIRPDGGVEEIPKLIEAGVCAFKFSTFGTDPVRFPRIPPPLMAEAFAAIAPSGLVAGVHNEHHESVMHGVAEMKRQGRTDAEAHNLSRPALSEALAIAEIYEIGAATGCRAHVVHCSIGRGFDLCESYRRQGFDTSIETCIHYLVLTEDDVKRMGGRAKVNPPLRPAAEREALWRHLAVGNIDFVSTDHVAWSLMRKNDPDIFKCSSGGPGMEVMLLLLLKGCLDRGLSPTWVSRLLAGNPARHFRLAPRKGALTVGADADIVVVEPGEFAYDPGTSQTVVQWSPYEGMTLPGRIAATYVRGQMAWDGAAVVVEPDFGHFVKPFGRT